MTDVRVAYRRGDVTCSACKYSIPDASAVAHCPACGWRERRGAD